MSTEADNTNPNAGGDDAAAKKAAEGTTEKKPRVTFDPIQQEFLDSFGDTMFGKGMQRAKAEFEPKLTEFQKKLEALERENLELKKPADKSEKKDEKVKAAQGEEVQKLIARLEEIEKANEALRAAKEKVDKDLEAQKETQKLTRVEREFISAARGIGFFNDEHVFRLLKDDIQWSDEHGQIVVINPKTGRPRMDETYETPLSLESYLKVWATENKHYVKAGDTSAGTGAGESRRVVTTDKGKPDFRNMSKEEFDAYKNSVRQKAFE
jgi:hypothetical protein